MTGLKILMDNNFFISRLEGIDWDFPGDNCASKFSTIHWHPCRFVSQIPAALIGLLTDPKGYVLDPYCGSGTTLVEAQRLGRRSLGIDINPISILLAESKLFVSGSKNITRSIRVFQKEILDSVAIKTIMRDGIVDSIPETVQVSKWYHEETAKELAYLWRHIRSSRSKYKRIFEAAFSSILLSVCNETRHWGYVCDNTSPKDIRRVDAIRQYIYALDRYIDAYRERDLYLGKDASFPLPDAVIINSDAALYMREIEDNVCDLIVTSPPYFGVCDYVKAQRLSMEWFGFDIEPYRRRETGARSKRHRKSALNEYLFELSNVIAECFRVLKPGGCLSMIVGESSARASIIHEVRSLLKETGFEQLFMTERAVPVQRRQHPSIKKEYVFIGKVEK